MQPNMQKFQLSEDEIIDVLSKAKMGVIATVNEDGSPYATPINYVLMDGRIFFHGRKEGEKVSNLKREPRCSFNVTITDGFERCGDDACNTTTNYESVIVKGRVVEIEDQEMKVRVLRATVDALTPARRSDPMNERMAIPAGVFEILIDGMTGKYHRPMPGHVVYKE